MSRRTLTGEQINPLPVVASPRAESSVILFAEQSLLQGKRLLRGWARDPATMIQALIYPALMLLVFRVALGDTITLATGKPSVYGTVPLITLTGAMSGAMVSAVGLAAEQRSGLLARFATMPVHRGADLAGRALAEASRIFLTTVLIVVVGVGLGLRFEQGALAALGALLVPVLFGIGFAVPVTALATMAKGGQMILIIGMVTTLLMFFNSGFVPIAAYPSWLQPIVEYQPMSCAIETMKGLLLGGPVRNPLLQTLAWSLGSIALFGYAAIRGYRRAAEHSG